MDQFIDPNKVNVKCAIYRMHNASLVIIFDACKLWYVKCLINNWVYYFVGTLGTEADPRKKGTTAAA